jgi:mRNA interferase MazF
MVGGEEREYVPERGDAIWLSFTSQAGTEQAGHRPAIVLYRSVYNEKAGYALVCPITSTVKGYPFEVPVPEGGEVSGVVLADQVRSLDWRARNARLIEPLPDAVTGEVVAKVQTLLQ